MFYFIICNGPGNVNSCKKGKQIHRIKSGNPLSYFINTYTKSANIWSAVFFAYPSGSLSILDPLRSQRNR